MDLKRADEALTALREAIRAGGNEASALIEEDQRFEPLREKL
jgi:hypothetical protein